MTKELIERLRSGITLYSACLENGDKHMTLLSEAADTIEAQQKRINELEVLLSNAANYLNETATCNSDKAVASTLTRGIGKSHLGLYYQLAAAQAQLVKLREVLKHMRNVLPNERWADDTKGMIEAALAQPSDDSVLRETLAMNKAQPKDESGSGMQGAEFGRAIEGREWNAARREDV